MLRPYCRQKALTIDDSLRPNAGRPYFKSTELSTIYNFPSPNLTDTLAIGVISFGGGMVGTVSPSGVLINGDCQKHWDYLGIPPTNFPQVIIVPVSGATNSPNPRDAATIENTIDVQTIGAMCPSAKLTILLYLAPNSFAEFVNVLAKASTATVIDGISYTPDVISCSWGATETLYPSYLLASLNAQLQTLSSKGIVFTAATGDFGSSNGLPGINCDFPSSSPYAIACGGTTLTCPNYKYDTATMEIGWDDGGGGISKIFAKPYFQQSLPGSGRNTPDVALVADPDTGVVYTIGNQLQVIGGTSIVSPAIAAYAAILNLKKAITPLLYTVPLSNFHDILMGSNGDYVAKHGYDNCTGFGSINGIRLANSLRGTMTDTSNTDIVDIPDVTDIPVTGISLNETTLQLPINTVTTLVATIVPADATNQTILWSSSNTSIAIVGNSGIVTAVRDGSATIFAITQDQQFTATCIITVIIPIIPVSSVIVQPSRVSLGLKQTMTLSATVLPTNASDKTIRWISSNPSVVSLGLVSYTNPVYISSIVANSTVITATGSGQATITAVSGHVQGTTDIEVIPPIFSITLIPAKLTMTVGSTSQTSVAFNPSQSGAPITLWNSSNTNVAIVDSNGLVTALKPGLATISGAVNGKIGKRVVIVPT
jgi:kumamolisin